jgi:hypothetical protein
MLGLGPEVTVEMAGFGRTCTTGKAVPPRVITSVPIIDDKLLPLLDMYYGYGANELYFLARAAFNKAAEWLTCGTLASDRAAVIAANATLTTSEKADKTKQAEHDRDRCFEKLRRTKAVISGALDSNVANCYRVAQERTHWWKYHFNVLQNVIANASARGCTQCRIGRMQFALNLTQIRLAQHSLIAQDQCVPAKSVADSIKAGLLPDSVSSATIASVTSQLASIKTARNAAIQQKITEIGVATVQDLSSRLEVVNACILEATNSMNLALYDGDASKWATKLQEMQAGRDLVATWQGQVATAIAEAQAQISSLETIQLNQVDNSQNCYIIRHFPVLYTEVYTVSSGIQHILRTMDHPGLYHMGLLQYMAEASVLRFQDFIRTFRSLHGWINGYVARQVQNGQLSAGEARQRLTDLRSFMERSYYYISRREFRRRVFIRDRCKRRFIRHARPLYRAIRVYQERYTILVDLREKSLASGQYFKAIEATTLLPTLLFQRRIYLRVLRRLIKLKDEACIGFMDLRTDRQLSEDIRQRQIRREKKQLNWVTRKSKLLSLEVRADSFAKLNATFNEVVSAEAQLLAASSPTERANALNAMSNTRAAYNALLELQPKTEAALSIAHQDVYQAVVSFIVDMRKTAERLICPRVACSFIPWARYSLPISFKSPFSLLGALAAKQLDSATKLNFNIVLRHIRFGALYSRLQYVDVVDQLDTTKATLTTALQSNPNNIPAGDLAEQVAAMESDIAFAKGKELHLWNVRIVDLQSKLQKYVTYQMRKEDTLRRRLLVGRATLAQPTPPPNSSAERALARIDQRVQASQAYTDALAASASSLVSLITAPLTRSEIVSTLQQLKAADDTALYDFDVALAVRFAQGISTTMASSVRYQTELSREITELTALSDSNYQTAITDLGTALTAENLRLATLRNAYATEAIQLRQSLLGQLNRTQQDSVWQARFWVDQLNMRVQYMVYLITRGLNYNPDVTVLTAFSEGPITPVSTPVTLIPASISQCLLPSDQTCTAFKVCPNGKCCNSSGVCGTSGSDCGSGTLHCDQLVLYSNQVALKE